nr:uncharacterized protein CTRU02_12994 [Colletotrichum truncatum]KAF6783978.1 hypothetical protein CTRU02_12994 [Colletotrichum truncatum]
MRFLTFIFATTALAQYCKAPPDNCVDVDCGKYYLPGDHGYCNYDDGKEKCPGRNYKCCRSQLDAALFCY